MVNEVHVYKKVMVIDDSEFVYYALHPRNGIRLGEAETYRADKDEEKFVKAFLENDRKALRISVPDDLPSEEPHEILQGTIWRNETLEMQELSDLIRKYK